MDGKLINGDSSVALLTTVYEDTGDAEQEAATTEITYQYHIFLPRCETYALRLTGSHVTGVYGPLEYDEVLFNALPNFPYSDRSEDVSWVSSNQGEFVLCKTEYEEGALWI